MDDLKNISHNILGPKKLMRDYECDCEYVTYLSFLYYRFLYYHGKLEDLYVFLIFNSSSLYSVNIYIRATGFSVINYCCLVPSKIKSIITRNAPQKSNG